MGKGKGKPSRQKARQWRCILGTSYRIRLALSGTLGQVVEILSLMKDTKSNPVETGTCCWNELLCPDHVILLANFRKLKGFLVLLPIQRGYRNWSHVYGYFWNTSFFKWSCLHSGFLLHRSSLCICSDFSFFLFFGGAVFLNCFTSAGQLSWIVFTVQE